MHKSPTLEEAIRTQAASLGFAACGFTRADAAIFAKITPRLRAQVNIENVFDENYYASAHNNFNITPGSPRAVRVALTTSF